MDCSIEGMHLFACIVPGRFFCHSVFHLQSGVIFFNKDVYYLFNTKSDYRIEAVARTVGYFPSIQIIIASR